MRRERERKRGIRRERGIESKINEKKRGEKIRKKLGKSKESKELRIIKEEEK